MVFSDRSGNIYLHLNERIFFFSIYNTTIKPVLLYGGILDVVPCVRFPLSSNFQRTGRRETLGTRMMTY